MRASPILSNTPALLLLPTVGWKGIRSPSTMTTNSSLPTPAPEAQSGTPLIPKGSQTLQPPGNLPCLPVVFLQALRSNQAVGKHQPVRGSLSSPFPCNLLRDLAEGSGHQVVQGKPIGMPCKKQPLTQLSHGTPCSSGTKSRDPYLQPGHPSHQPQPQEHWFFLATFSHSQWEKQTGQ